MTRHFIVTDLDGKNPRHLTLEQYNDAVDRGEQFRLSSLVVKYQHDAATVVRPIRGDCETCEQYGECVCWVDGAAPRDLNESFNQTFGRA